MNLNSKPKNSKLTPRQRAFVTAYLADPKHNATNAGIKAGFSKKTAQEQSSRLLSNVMVSAEIEKRLVRLEEKSDLTVEYVLKTLKEIVERCMTHVPVMEFDHVEKEMVQKEVLTEVEGKEKWVGLYEFDSSGANKAIENIGKHLKMFTDRVEHTVAEGVFERLERARLNANKAA